MSRSPQFQGSFKHVLFFKTKHGIHVNEKGLFFLIVLSGKKYITQYVNKVCKLDKRSFFFSGEL